MEDQTYQRLRERYESGNVPWDDPLPPPEVQALAETLSPGRALDLGTGYGRAAIYLAQQGWQVDAVDFLALPLEEAKQRARRAGVAVHFHQTPVTELGSLAGPYDLAIDVGCMHSLAEPDLRVYHGHLRRLLRPGAAYLLFAHLRDEEEVADGDGEEERPRGIPEALVRRIFADGFELQRLERGVTQVEDRPPWNSGWFWYRRAAATGLSRR